MRKDWDILQPRMTIRWLSPEQYDFVERAVALSGLSRNAWMRRAALQVAEVEELIRADERGDPIHPEAQVEEPVL